MASEAYQPNWHVRAISAPGLDTDLSLHVSFDNARFLFGCGEGTQRAFVQKRMGMKGLAGIFLGSGEARSRAGLAGVLMTAADGGIPKVDIIGPPDMSHYLSTLRSSVIRDSLTVNMRSYPRSAASGEPVELFKSRNITVHGIALIPEPDNTAGPSRPTPTYTSSDPHSPSFRPSRLSPSDTQKWCDQIICDIFHNGPKARSSRRHPQPPQSGSGSSTPPKPINPFINPDNTICSSIPDTRYPLPLPSKEDVETQMVYICQAPEVRGKFNVEKANQLGVPKGPVRGKLTKGESIEVDDPNVEGGKRIVKPEDCLVGGGPGSVLIVVNCSEKTKSILLDNPAFHRYQPLRASDESESRHVHLIVHRVPRSVWISQEYKDWMQSFGERTQHLIADPVEYPDRTVFNSAAWNTLQLSLSDSQIFTPPFVTSPHPPSVNLPPNTSFLVEGSYCRMHPPAQVTVNENHSRDIPFLITSSEAESARETIRQDMPDYSNACDIAQKAILADPRYSSNSLPPGIGDDITVTTLGTGSAIPSKYRNVSSTYLDIPDLGGILLDAGEGTLGQMKRRFGQEGIKKLLGEMKMVFISHMHADHHLGLNSVLEERFKLGITSPLYLIAPSNIALTLQEQASWQYAATSQEALENVIYMNIQRLGYKIDNRRSGSPTLNDRKPRSPSPSDKKSKSPSLKDEDGEFKPPSPKDRKSKSPPPATSPSPTREEEMDQWDKEALDDIEHGRRAWPFRHVYGFSSAATRDHWKAVRNMMRDLSFNTIWAPIVPHRGRAYGLAIEHRSGWKIVYSGDTKPSEELVQAGQNATLLIHEATLEDDKPEVAAVKGHSTFSQAIDVGKRMNAKHILLNHFSQRYPKLPKLPIPNIVPTSSENGETTVQEIAPVVSISFDFMSIKIGSMWKMSYYMEPLSLLFVEAEEEGEGEDSVLGAVKNDINPSVDVAISGEGKVGKNNKGKNKNKVKDKDNKNEELVSNGAIDIRNGDGEDGKSKKSLKKEVAKASKAAQFKRPASPMKITEEPMSKRRSTDSTESNEEGNDKMEVDV